MGGPGARARARRRRGRRRFLRPPRRLPLLRARWGFRQPPPLCTISKDGKFLRLTSAPPGTPTGPAVSRIREFDVSGLKKKDVKDGLRDLIVFADAVPFPPGFKELRDIDKSYGFNKFSKRWSKMRKKGPTKAVPALVGLGEPSDFEIKLDNVKFLKDKKGKVYQTEYQVGKNARDKLVKKFGKSNQDFKRECVISYATPCKKLGLPQRGKRRMRTHSVAE